MARRRLRHGTEIAARRQLFLILNVSTLPFLALPSILSPVSRIRFGMSIMVSGSVHSMTSTSPAASFDKSLRVLSVGSGHFSPRMLTAAALAAGVAAGFLVLDSDLDF